MGGLAALAREAGHKVTGCDAGVYPPMSDQLKALGIELMEGFGVEQMQLKPDLYVIGNVVSRSRLPSGEPNPTPVARNGCQSMCCKDGMYWLSQARMAKRLRPLCWPGYWKLPDLNPAF
ncbi:MAG: UDP-N-acetylmuramate:L-alanyl-gamma-D-glutamyl-meso-diaminopimelate ligase [Pseudomonadota bacterium]